MHLGARDPVAHDQSFGFDVGAQQPRVVGESDLAGTHHEHRQVPAPGVPPLEPPRAGEVERCPSADGTGPVAEAE
ncbi:hypothetical protein [Nocardioides daejeonensis]|uniref:hypothetical protein n=1 Tax=Nocardioides daejeonensis TaxID=1046556 RepID=UPI000D744C95|nr:hypothetical protein [Nocardioides daejeonensis]